MVSTGNHNTKGKPGELLKNEGSATCGFPQVTSKVRNMCAVRNSANNVWNVNLSNGNVNNNNTYNRNLVAGASESFIDIDRWEAAERGFFKNKHGSKSAQKLHVHPGWVVRVAYSVATGQYRPQRAYRFPLLEPSPREIYASFSLDRLVHHFVAPFITKITETVHRANGDISHGNRIGRSAQTGAEQIRDAIAEASEKYAEPYVVKMDIRSFFPSIPRQRAFEDFKQYANEYYPGNDEIIELCSLLITHDPTVNCVTLPGPWEKIPKRKIMPTDGSGKGLPIGNYYSQLIANLYLAKLDAALKPYGINPRFVDDKCCIVPDKGKVQIILDTARKVTESLGLRLHPDKIYIQPAHRGVNFCGRTIKGGRIYLSNRTLRKAYRAVKIFPKNECGAIDMCATANCYLGLMLHCTEHKNALKYSDFILSFFGEWLYFAIRCGNPVCRIKARYNKRKQLEGYYRKLLYAD